MTKLPSDLIDRARAGDRHAFAQLVELCYPRALRFARQMVGQSEDAEEAVQDSFIRVHRYLDGFKPGAAFEPWFFRILANRCRTMLEKRRRHRAVIEYGEVPANAAEIVPAATDVDLHHAVLRVLDTLPTEQREAFLLRHIEDLSYEDMMDITGAGLSALRMRVKRACDTLREQLTEVHYDR